jgi:hypothetical protein
MQSITRCKYNLSITEILEQVTLGNSFELGFYRYEYTAPSTIGGTGTWANEGSVKATMAWITPPAGYASAYDYRVGYLSDTTAVVIGSLDMGWVSSFLRKASIEIDSVTDVDCPMDKGLTGDGRFDWKRVFRNIYLGI